ncbi:hypothetical protein [Desulforhopalus singaporensis]|uniref:FAD:protein FMN transferase n=1 Tax=Desulforhopalus singaporensis TaxID=91360 RepID=A0A1H0N6F4_9BACT|nr:hypothetical protein [Desulforhopalus singaporensis]SDO88228.1 hypothetical protein SAMN05660330_01268 [Desulforhopalus singaporensis]
MDDRRVEIFAGKPAVLVENGPLRLVIQAYHGDEAATELVAAEAEFCFDCLKRVAENLDLLKLRHGTIKELPDDELARTMVESVRLIGDADLTPMAAVAGTIADFVADHLFRFRITKVIVDNGGDIAVRLAKGERATVGFRPRIDSAEISHVVHLAKGPKSWGVNTSGMGGRSLTRGIASAVSVFADNSSVADGGATAVANSCFVDDCNIRQVPANSIDPHTDLGDMGVTVGIDGVTEKNMQKALANGLERADLLVERGLVRGAILCVGQHMALTHDFSRRVGELHQYQG